MNIDATSYIGNYQNSFNSPITIGKYSAIGNNIRTISSTHPSIFTPAVSNYPFAEKLQFDYPKCIHGRPIIIENDVWIGEDVTLIAPVTIGNGAIIGAGSVVAKDIEPYAVVVGNPIKLIRYRFKKEQIDKLNKIKWWDWSKELIKERISDMKDIEVFLTKYENPMVRS